MLDVQGLRIRAALFRFIREFFTEQGFLEVDTPIRQSVLIPEANIVPIEADGQFLQTSPELYMKRLLARGCDKIFQICPCFRKGELGSRHLEEFTMLEWYRRDADYTSLMADCEELLDYVVPKMIRIIEQHDCFDSRVLEKEPFSTAPTKINVEDAFHKYASISAAEAIAAGTFDEILVEYVEPNLGIGGPEFLFDYPVELASLAKVKESDPSVAERFELYISGVELANGFSELTDAEEQRNRFEEEIALIRENYSREAGMPEQFLEDLEGIGTAAGIAFGIDRLLMLLLNRASISEVVGFS